MGRQRKGKEASTADAFEQARVAVQSEILGQLQFYSANGSDLP